MRWLGAYTAIFSNSHRLSVFRLPGSYLRGILGQGFEPKITDAAPLKSRPGEIALVVSGAAAVEPSPAIFQSQSPARRTDAPTLLVPITEPLLP